MTGSALLSQRNAMINNTMLKPESRAQKTGTLKILLSLTLMVWTSIVLAHGVASGDQSFISSGSGRMLFEYMYLGAKHMVTGYDHLLFLAGVIFFLYRMRDIGLYVTLFAIGHSITMLLGVLGHIQINPYIIDAIIGFSVVYKAADNLGLWQRWFGWAPDTRVATLIFGLLHGFGLATKIQEFGIPEDGLLANLLAFNIGVEVGQLLVLAAILVLMGFWRRAKGFWQQATVANYLLMLAGLGLMAFQIYGLFHNHN